MGLYQKIAASVRTRLVPWLWIPALLGMSCSVRITSIISLAAPVLLIPIAALLGARYQRRGLVMMALGGLLLPLGLSYAYVSAGPYPDVYLVALYVCALGSMRRPLRKALPTFRPSVLFFVIFFLLPLAVGLYGSRVGDAEIRVVWRGMWLFYLLLFVLGLSQFRLGVLLPALAIASCVGMLLGVTGLPRDARALFGGPRAELPLYGLIELRYLWVNYTLNSPAAFLTGLGYFGAGRLFAAMLETKRLACRPQSHVYGVVLAIAVVALGGELNQYLWSRVTGLDLAPYFRLLGSAFALPLAALLGGLLLYYRGIVLMLLLVPLFWGLDGLLRSGFDVSQLRLFFPLHEPLYVLAFGALGLKMRDMALGTVTVWWSRRWALYILLLLVVLLSWSEIESPGDLLLLALAFAGSLAVGIAAVWLRQQVLGRIMPTHGGWLAFLSVVLLGILVGRNRASAVELLGALRELFTQIVSAWWRQEGVSLDTDEWIPPVGALVFLWIFLSALYMFLRHVPACVRDLRGIAQATRAMLTMGPDGWRGNAEPPQDVTRVLPGFWTGWLRILNVVRYVPLIAALALPLLVVYLEVYPRDGLWSAVRSWWVSTPPTAPASPPRLETSPAPRANPWLWQAALAYVADMPIREADPQHGRLHTNWYNKPQQPMVRIQVTFSIGPDLRPSSLQVHLRRQERGRFGIWVEQDKFWDPKRREFVGHDPFVESQQIAQEVFEHAQALQKAQPQ